MGEAALASTILILLLLFFITWLFVALGVYVLPIILAVVRKHQNVGAITVLTLFLGWTFLGWLAALLWSLNADVNKEEE